LLGELPSWYCHIHDWTNSNQADGRDSQAVMMSSSLRRVQEVYVPYLENGSVHYLARETISANDRLSAWVIKDSPTPPLPTVAKPTPLNFIATEADLDMHPPSKFDF
jgi:hypothetical protein